MMKIIIAVLLSVINMIRAEGYWDIELSPQSVGTVPHGPGQISIWKHNRQQNRYYATPLVYLLQDTADTRDNILTGETELTFLVQMWSLEAQEAVYIYLKDNINPNVTPTSIEMLPMEKIRLVWRSLQRSLSSNFRLNDEWKTNTHLPSQVQFQFSCEDATKCLQLKTVMKTQPDMFYALELEYIINGQRSARRTMTIMGRHLLKGQLYSKLTNLKSANVYVNIEDLKTITQESVSNVFASIVTDDDYIDTGDDIQMKDILLSQLKSHEESTANFEPEMWESVFWDPTFARPDKMTRYLNKVLTKDTSDSRKFILNENLRSRSMEGGGSGSRGSRFMGTKVQASGAASSSSRSKVQREDVLKTLAERHNHVEWDGERFRVRPMKLYRQNIGSMSQTSTVVSGNIQVRRYETVHSIKMRLSKQSTETSSLTPQLVQARVAAKLATMKAGIARSLSSTNAQLGAKIARTKTELNAAVNRIPRGTTYIRWGRTSCPNTGTELVYHGYAGAGHYTHKGGPGNLLCLTRHPQLYSPTPAQDTQGYIYGAEYQYPRHFVSDANSPIKQGRHHPNGPLHDQDVPCAVCRTHLRSSKVMIPGRYSCHGAGWTREYRGMLMGGHWNHATLNAVCVDHAPEPIPGGQANRDGAILYILQAACGSLKCPPYTQNYEFTCVVCTK